MSRLRSVLSPRWLLSLGVLVTAANCGQSSPTPSAQPARTPSRAEQDAVKHGMSVVSSDAAGKPRLVRAIAPRPQAAGVTSTTEAARDHVKALASIYVDRDRPADLVQADVQKLRNGSSVVKFTQQIDSVEIHEGDVRVMLRDDGSLAAVSGTVRAMTGGKPQFTRSAREAVVAMLGERFGKQETAALAPLVREAKAHAGYVEFFIPPSKQLQVRSARAKRKLFDVAGKLVPVWSVEIIASRVTNQGRKADAWRYLISDRDGAVLRTTDLVKHDAFVYRTFADRTGTRQPFDGPLASYNPHPTGTPDGTLPGFVPSTLVSIDSFNATRDPWLPSNATTTAGNNVEAYANRRWPDEFGEGDVRPEVRSGRILNFTYDFSKDPLANVNQAKAAATNLFFVTNWLHDWYYDSGFTEAAGNAQADNYGRGGFGGDRLLALAQDQAFDGARDNAYMVTPEDGLSPSMHMFLWSPTVNSSVTFGGATHPADHFIVGPKNFKVTGQVALGTDGVGEGPNDGCEPLTNDLTGKIAVLEWTGWCDPTDSLRNAQAAGATAAIVWSVDFAFGGYGGLDDAFRGLYLGPEDGATLRAAMDQGPVTVTLRRETIGVEPDGDFDHGIVAHEWGHYLHLRLATCEQLQCSAMSEGWGDFTALHMMLRPEDNREGTFTAGGTYAMSAGGLLPYGFQDPGYFGIRRYPYSIDRSKNALSFGHIADSAALPADTASNPGPIGNGNAEVHNAGEVWATMLWEAYNALIDQHGLVEARRRMSDYAVAGLLLTPPSATFTEGRDAILAAAAELDSDDMLLLAAAFAGRGAGSCAVSPPNSSFTQDEVVENGTLSGRLEAYLAPLADEGVSCDNDGYLDPGERATLHVTLTNSGVSAVEGVSITATTTTPGVTLGEPVALDAVSPFDVYDLEIPVSIDADAPVASELAIDIRIDGEGGCHTEPLLLTVRQRLGVDDLADSSKTDDVEALITPWTLAGDAAESLWSRAEVSPGNHAWFGVDAPFTSDTQLVSPVLQVSADESFVVSLQHAYNLEFFEEFYYDGGVVEVTTDGGATWRDASEFGVVTYPGVISVDWDNPLLGRPAFIATNPAYPARDTLSLDFGLQLAGQTVQLRFRIGTDFCCVGTGWELDNFSASGIDNTPFPSVVAETEVCDLGEEEEDFLVAGSSQATLRPRTKRSLAAFPVRIDE